MADWDEGKRVSKEVAAEVAPLLGDGWTFKDDPQHFGGTVLGPDEADLFFRMDGKRLVISGSYPDGAYNKAYGYETHRITVSPGRPAEAIAKEVQRRLLPHYLPTLATVLRRIQQHDEGVDGQRRAAAELAAIVGEEPRESEVYVSLHQHGTYGKVRVLHGGDRVSLELSSLDVDRAKRVLAILND